MAHNVLCRGGSRGGGGVQGVATPPNHPEQSHQTASKAYYSLT